VTMVSIAFVNCQMPLCLRGRVCVLRVGGVAAGAQQQQWWWCGNDEVRSKNP